MFESFKLFFGGLPLANIKNYALVGLIIYSSFITLLYQLEKTSHKLTAKESELFKSQVEWQSTFRLEQIKQLDAIYAENELELKEKHKAENDARDLDRAKITKDLKNEINRNSSMFNDVILYKDRAFGAGLSKDEIPADILTEGSRDCNRTIAILTKAGQSCAIDYNSLYDAWMKQCDVYGCE